MKQGIERCVIRLAETGCEIIPAFTVLIHIRFQHQRAQSRRQGEGVDGGQADRDGHGNTELRVECTRGSSHERGGYEYRHEDHGRNDNGRRYAAHRIGSRLISRPVPRVETALHGFHHDNGIVHYRADGKHQREEREQVDGEPRHCHESECRDDRDEYGYGGNQCRAYILQKQVHDKHDQQDCQQKRHRHFPDGGIEKTVRIAYRDELEAFRQVLAHLFENRVDLVDDRRSVGACRLVGHGKGARLAVDGRTEIIRLAAQFDIRDLFQAEHVAAGQ